MDVQELVGLVPWTFVAQICNLFIQVYLIKRFLFKPVNEMLEKRKALADAQIREAEKAKADADAIKTEYEQNMKEAKEKANEILTTAQRTAALQSEEMLKEAASQAAALKSKAESDIAQEKRKAVNEIKDEIGGIAVEIAGKVIEREISEEDHTKLIDEFIANVGEAS
ncbi:F0F1 ATP synthase subunit B [Candidatus Merdisoma sp. HCP28S3_D10]|uniref:F0F1 ATP synthase subunit B n=1 Tax=unclassified Candidatus Merdisoma TaxID=3099611 RepID=UPI003F8B0FBB